MLLWLTKLISNIVLLLNIIAVLTKISKSTLLWLTKSTSVIIIIIVISLIATWRKFTIWILAASWLHIKFTCFFSFLFSLVIIIVLTKISKPTLLWLAKSTAIIIVIVISLIATWRKFT